MASKEYMAALEVSRIAGQEFRKAQEAYRARTIGDCEFLLAKAKHDADSKAFDLAYEQEVWRTNKQA